MLMKKGKTCFVWFDFYLGGAGLLRTAMITRLLWTMVGESVGGRQNFFLFGFFLSLPPLTVHWCFLTTEMETLIRHGRRCLSCAGLTLFTLLKHNLTGDGYTGKHICRSIATYSIYIFCLYLDSSSSYSSCINRINSCLDEAAELALLPSFDGCIGEMNVSGNESCYFTQKKKKKKKKKKMRQLIKKVHFRNTSVIFLFLMYLHVLLALLSWGICFIKCCYVPCRWYAEMYWLRGTCKSSKLF